MKRRTILAIAAVLSATLAGFPTQADIVDDVVAELKGMGYAEITVERTLLGRVRIMAYDEGGYREIIVNPRTGEILRDLFVRSGGHRGKRLLRDTDRDDDDRDDDRDDDNSGSGSDSDDSDDRDDDNSGSGSNSGSGGSDDDDNGGSDDD